MAVLPFTCLGDEQGQEYFTDGLTEEMIAQLGRLCRGRIGVIARQSSMAFKGTTRGAREIGQALRAGYLLEGSVRREGDRVRITARLVETAGETNLWVETYERHLTDCLSVQAEVAARIAQSLAMELAPEQPSARLDVRSPDAAAYQAYLKARYFWNKPGDEASAEALAYFQQAIGADPSYAPRRTRGSPARTCRGRSTTVSARALALEKARDAAERALQLDPALSEAHLALGEVRRMLQWDTRAARSAYAQAIALNPSYETRAPRVRVDADVARAARAGHSRIGPRLRARSALPDGQHQRCLGAIRGGRLRRRDRACACTRSRSTTVTTQRRAGCWAPRICSSGRRGTRCRCSRRRARPATSIRWRWRG